MVVSDNQVVVPYKYSSLVSVKTLDPPVSSNSTALTMSSIDIPNTTGCTDDEFLADRNHDSVSYHCLSRGESVGLTVSPFFQFYGEEG